MTKEDLTSIINEITPKEAHNLIDHTKQPRTKRSILQPYKRSKRQNQI